MSESKEVVITYLEQLRGLRKKEYEIQKEEILESGISLQYEDIYATEWNGFYIPTIDISIINTMAKPAKEEIDNTINILTSLLLVSKDIKKVRNSEITSIIDTIRALDRFRNTPKIINKIEFTSTIQNSILYMPMKKYVQTLNSYKNMILEYKYGYENWGKEDV